VHGAPRYVRLDTGPQFVSTALWNWAVQERIETALINPGNRGRMARAKASTGNSDTPECVAMEWLPNRIEAKIVIEDWPIHHNEVRPHSTLKYQTLAEFRRASGCNSTAGAVNFYTRVTQKASQVSRF